MFIQRNVTLLLGQMELVLVELEAGAELDVTECAEVAGAKIVGCTDLSSSSGRRMERGRGGRREFRRAGCVGWGSAGE
jgi:hypothetical protein